MPKTMLAAMASDHPLLNQMVSPHKIVRSRTDRDTVLGCMGLTY